jgi:hypothetical protein
MLASAVAISGINSAQGDVIECDGAVSAEWIRVAGKRADERKR